MLVKKKLEAKLLKLTQFQSGEIVSEQLLDKKKILVGSSPTCDLVIEHPSVSHYHAMLSLDENGGKIIDLESSNGIYVNGERVNSCFFCEGDIIKFGPVEFHVHEQFVNIEKNEDLFEDQDKTVKKIDEITIIEKPQELPPKEGLVVIDGEYCDIIFDESQYSPVSDIPAHQFSAKEYVEFDENEEQIEIFRHDDNKAIEVSILSMGTIISVDYFKIKNGTYFASSDISNNKTLQVYNLEADDIIPFIKVNNGEVVVSPLPEFKYRNISKNKNLEGPTSLSGDDVLSLDFKTVQVMIKVVDAPPSIRLAPFFGRDINFQKQTAKIFSAVMGIMLLLLLVDINLEEPKKKKIAVIYRKAVESNIKNMKKSAEDVNKKNVDKGIKKKQQDNEKPKFAKKMEKQTKQNLQEVKQPKKMAESKSQPTKAVKKPKMKAYQFKSSKSFSSLFSTKSNLAKADIQNTKTNSAKGFETAKTQNTKGLKSTQSVNMGSLGQDFKGKYNSSSGAYGLASKSGIDTSYVDTKTVVLGSMDPELLRKILREYLPQFRHCYQQELQQNDKLKGIVDLDFRIGKSGSVSKVNIKVKNAKFSKKGVGCMAGVLKLIPFPKPKGGGVVDVRQPLSFFSETEKN